VTEDPSILVVDDTRANAELVCRVLAAEGFRTMEANDGPTARQLCRSQLPDLVLLDVMMPGESGFETCARLKSDPITADIPIIFLSALDDVKNKVAGLKIGGVDYLSKPVHGEELLARVRVHLRIRSTNRMLIDQQRAKLEQLRTAQRAILVRPEECPDARFSVFFRPLEEAGGDFYDVLEIAPGVFGYFVADISGHGVSASFLTAALKALLRQYTGPMFSPEDSMRGLDAVMRQILGEEQYLTACYARWNRHTGCLSVVSAGHPPVVLVRSSGEARVIEVESEPLGVFSTQVLQRKEVRMAPGERFFLYSDGLIELECGSGRQEGLRLLMEACARHRKTPIQEAAWCIARELRPDSGKVTDDLLLLAVEARR
jgi:sigma-B regulation protein RsbU (phosphoserine phosphatase)